MTPDKRARLAVLVIACAVVLVAVGAVGNAARGDEPAATSAGFTVSDAALRWSVNDETNNAAFAPGTWNLLSAGTIGNPGAGGQSLRIATSGRTWGNGRAAGWTNHSGNTTIEDLGADGRYTPATFEGTRRNAAGASTSPPGSPVVAETQVVLRGGVGTVDPSAGTATVSWRGSFSVLYYSGMTYFVVSNPVLRVTPDSAKVTATASGYATSMDDPSKWKALPGETVTLADFDAVGLTGKRGFTANPRYLGVRYDAPASGTAQLRSGAQWGSFPTSLVRFLDKVGMASYWYSSGGATDSKKVAAPVSISWNADAPVANPTRTAAPAPTAQPSVSLAPAPPAQSPASPAPPAPPAPTVTVTDAPFRPRAGAAQLLAPTAPPSAALPEPAVSSTGTNLVAVADSGALRTVYAADHTAPAARAGDDQPWEWTLGGAFFLLALGLAAYPYRTRLFRRRTHA